MFVPKAIWTELISRYHNNPRARYFDIEKTPQLLVQKYYKPTFCHNVKAYVKDCDVCLAFKIVCYQLYGDCQLFLVSMHQ